jgi:uncharacterized protein
VTVVSDTSPILNLAAIQQLDLLGVLSPSVMVPPSVAQELRHSGFNPAESGRLVVQPLLDWKAARRLLSHLDIGESEAIVLAIEQRADLLLIDEKRGRRIATGFGLRVLGLLGLLTEAKQRGVLKACKPLLDQLITCGFWVARDLYLRFLDEVGEPAG